MQIDVSRSKSSIDISLPNWVNNNEFIAQSFFNPEDTHEK